MKSKKLIMLAVIIALVLASCAETISVTPKPPNIRVYNSAWDIIRAERVETSRNLTSTAGIEDYVQSYNANHTDDQLFIIEGEEVVPIELAPNVDAYIVDAITYDIVQEYLQLPREHLVIHRDLWKLQLVNIGNAKLFIDNVPPAPVPPEPIPDYIRYACYTINEAGTIIFETHCENWQEEGFTSIDASFAWYSYAVRVDAQGTPGWTYVIGRLYP